MHAYMHIYANKSMHIYCILDEYMHNSHARDKYFMYSKAIDNIYFYIKVGVFVVKVHKRGYTKQLLCIIIQQK